MELTKEYHESVFKHKVEAFEADFKTALKISREVFYKKLESFIANDEYSEAIKKVVLSKIYANQYNIKVNGINLLQESPDNIKTLLKQFTNK